MINDSVNLFYAKDEYENIILINEINDSNREKYYVCPICGNQVKPRAINSEKISPHFYHINAAECNPESMLHWWYKNKFLISGSVFKVSTDGVISTYKCKDILIEKTYETSFGDYRPDLTITTSDDKEIFVEYNYSNKKNVDEYIDKWFELGRTVVEIDIRSLMNRYSKVFKAMFDDGLLVNKTRGCKKYSAINKYINVNNIKDRIRIKYLNGFLLDCYRYNKGKISIEDIVTIIDNMNKEDLLSVPKLLKGLKCNNILCDYVNYKLGIVYNMLDEILRIKRLNNPIYKDIVKIDYKMGQCRGVKFNNTILVIKSVGDNSPFENTYWCNEVFFMDNQEIKKQLSTGVESVRRYMVRKNKKIVKASILNKKNIVTEYLLEAIKNKMSEYDLPLNDASILRKIYVTTTIGKSKTNLKLDFDLYNKLKQYRGIGRKDFINDIIDKKISKIMYGYKNANIDKYISIIKYLDKKYQNIYFKNNGKLSRIRISYDVRDDLSILIELKYERGNGCHIVKKTFFINHNILEYVECEKDRTITLTNRSMFYTKMNNIINKHIKLIGKETKIWRFK